VLMACLVDHPHIVACGMVLAFRQYMRVW